MTTNFDETDQTDQSHPTDATPISRKLAPSELQYLLGGATVAHNLYGSGRLDAAALSDALDALARKYPLLGGQITGRSLNFRRARRPQLRFEEVHDERVDDYVLGPASALPMRQVCSVRVAYAGDRFRMTLLLRHAIADARAGLKYLQDLWDLYTCRIESGATPVVAPEPVPPPLEAMLTARGFTPADEQLVDLAQTQNGSVPLGTPWKRHRPERGRVRLSREETTALQQAGRANGLTLHGLVCAAALLAEHELSDEDESTAMLSSFVDLRNRMDPPVSAAGGTNVLGPSDVIVRIANDSNPFSLGSVVLDELRDSLASGHIHRVALRGLDRSVARRVARDFARQVVRTRRLPVHHVSQVTNWGTIPALRTPADVTLDDFRGGVELAAPAAAAVRMGAGTARGHLYFVTSFDGRLSVEFNRLSSKDETAAHVEEQLRGVFDRLLAA